MTISILIVTYNSENVIKDCILSLEKAFEAEYTEIIIVDNNSTDTSVERVKEIAKHSTIPIRLIPLTSNTGFAAGCNTAASYAKGIDLFFINPDTVFSTTDRSLIKSRIIERETAIVGFRVFNSDNSLQPSVGKFPTLTRIIFDRIPIASSLLGIQLRDPKVYAYAHTVDWVSGSGLVISKYVFTELHGFDEAIFMYGEDFDLCYRAFSKGYEVGYIPDVHYMHLDSGKNRSERKPHKYYFMRLNLLRFLYKYRSRASAEIFKRMLCIEARIRLLYYRILTSHKRNDWEEYLLKTIRLNTHSFYKESEDAS